MQFDDNNHNDNGNDILAMNDGENEERSDIENRKGKSEIPGFSRTLRIIFCYILPVMFVAAIIIVCVWGSKQKTLAEGYRNTTENMYRQAYTELADSVYNVQISLSKLLVSEAPSTLAYTLDDIWRESGVCVGLMGQIPQSHIDNYEMNQFLVRLGDYARTLSLSVMKGKPISAEDREQLTTLYNASISLHSELQAKLDSGDFPTESITSEQFFATNMEQNEGSQSGESQNSNDEAASRYPTLIYDGPFSESTEKQEARGVTGNQIDENIALERAKEVLTNNKSNDRTFGEQQTNAQSTGVQIAEINFEGFSNGKIPTYDFSGSFSDGRHFDIAITVYGGHLLWLRADSKSDIGGLPEEEEADALIQSGIEWLKMQGYSNMTPTYAQYYNGIAIISYAATQEEVILYNDLVKVYIDRSDRSICGADAQNYLFSHVERELSTETLPVEEVQSMLSPLFNVVETNLALVPATAQTEVLCYEFKGNLNDDEFVIYLDAATGDEVQIFRIISDENGQLAI